MRIYISGPITGVENYLEHFKKAEEYWLNKGFSCINPAAVNSMMPNDTTYEEYMKMAFTMLGMCDAIYLLKGWEKSRGANREYGYALAKGFTIFEHDELENNQFGQGMVNPESILHKNEPLSSENEPISKENDTPNEKHESGGQRKSLILVKLWP